MAKLTGNIRFRQSSRIIGKSIVVLQVEFRYTHIENAGALVDVYSATAWRDAKVEDLLELDFKRCKNTEY